MTYAIQLYWLAGGRNLRLSVQEFLIYVIRVAAPSILQATRIPKKNIQDPPAKTSAINTHVNQLGNGDEAFVKMLEENDAVIGKICYVEARNPKDRKDLKQEIIRQLLKAWPSFRGESKVSTWIWRIGLRVSTRFNRDRAITIVYVETLPDTQFEMPVEISDWSFTILGQLPEPIRQMIILHLEGYNNKEIASMLQLSEDVVNQRLSRFRKSIGRK